MSRNGGRLLARRVAGFDIGPEGVRGLRTEAGYLETRQGVGAAGAWSRALVRALGRDVPLEAERGYHVTLADPGIDLSPYRVDRF